jgi:DNA-binding transcriptional ArsR family regulator
MNVFQASTVTKLDVLSLLASLPGLSAAEVADRLRISPEASGMLLLRLTRAGLLDREPEHGVFVYTLTAKGRARRTYLAHRTDARTE